MKLLSCIAIVMFFSILANFSPVYAIPGKNYDCFYEQAQADGSVEVCTGSYQEVMVNFTVSCGKCAYDPDKDPACKTKGSPGAFQQSDPWCPSGFLSVNRCTYSDVRFDGNTYECDGLKDAAGTCRTSEIIPSNCRSVRGGSGPAASPGSVESVFGNITPPSFVRALGPGAGGIRNFLTIIIRIIYIVSAVIFLFMLIIAALQFITSGGDKEALAGARKRITYAIIGIVLLAVSFVIVSVLGNILNINFYTVNPGIR